MWFPAFGGVCVVQWWLPKKKRSAQAKMAPWWGVVMDFIASIGPQNYSDSIQCSFHALSPQLNASAHNWLP